MILNLWYSIEKRRGVEYMEEQKQITNYDNLELLDMNPKETKSKLANIELSEDTLVRASLLGAGALLVVGGALLHKKHPVVGSISIASGLGCVATEVARTVIKKQEHKE